MATKGIKIKLNDAGVKELLQSDEMQEACVQAAQAVANAAGSDYEIGDTRTQVRAGAYIETTTDAAYRERNRLLKALGSVIPARKIKRYK